MVRAPRLSGQGMPVGHGKTRAKNTSIATPMQISGTTIGNAMPPSSAVFPGNRNRHSNTADNAPRVKAHMICEAANGATTPGGDEILEDRGVLVLPDVVANAGGVVVSYFEWVQGLQEYFWKEYEVNAKLNDIVVRAFEETWSARERFGTSPRMAAYGLAVQRVAEATITRGLYP